MRNRIVFVGAVVVLTLLCAPALRAWGGFTHQHLSHRALLLLARESRAAETLLRDHRLLAAFLGGSMAPDLAQDFFRGEAEGSLHRMYHSDEFCQALLDASRHDEETFAGALGWRAHVLADRGAHGTDGYANRKRTFNGALAGQNHTVAEALLDVLVLREKGPHRQSLFADADAIVEAARTVGHETTRDEIVRQSRRFRRSVNTAETLFLALGRRQAKGILPAIERFYADSAEGLVDGLGKDRAVDFVVEGLRPLLGEELPVELARLAEDEDPDRAWGIGLLVREGSQQVGARIGSLGARIPGAEWLGDRAVAVADRFGWMKRGASLEFFRRLLTTKERNFVLFSANFERDWAPSEP